MKTGRVKEMTLGSVVTYTSRGQVVCLPWRKRGGGNGRTYLLVASQETFIGVDWNIPSAVTACHVYYKFDFLHRI